MRVKSKNPAFHLLVFKQLLRLRSSQSFYCWRAWKYLFGFAAKRQDKALSRSDALSKLSPCYLVPRKLSGCHSRLMSTSQMEATKKAPQGLNQRALQLQRDADARPVALGHRLPFLCSSRFFGPFYWLGVGTHSMAARANSAGCTPNKSRDKAESRERIFQHSLSADHQDANWLDSRHALIDQGEKRHPKRNLLWHSAGAFVTR